MNRHRKRINKNRAESVRRKKLNNPLFKLKESIKNTIRGSFTRGSKRFKKAQRTESILGCSIEFFINYILSKCPDGITVKDFGIRGYHIDHIMPISIATT